jgi:hypothetical protein
MRFNNVSLLKFSLVYDPNKGRLTFFYVQLVNNKKGMKLLENLFQLTNDLKMVE